MKSKNTWFHPTPVSCRAIASSYDRSSAAYSSLGACVPWSLDYQPTKSPTALGELLSVAGRALYIATSFERKCKDLLTFARMAKAVDESDGSLDAVVALVGRLKDKLLHGTIQELRTFPELHDADFSVLERGREARNFICHELCDIGPISSASTRSIQGALEALRVRMPHLVAADDLVSSWLYEIEEKEAAPSGIRTEYPGWLMKWTFNGTRT